jgi:SEC-C motif-containing protein
MNLLTQCPCNSGESYQNCCCSFHQGKFPPTALALMRSRYSAYALGLADYIIKTTHPQNEQPLSRETIQQFSASTQFKNLEILKIEEGPKTSTVTFKASLMNNGQDISFTEKSLFEKIGDQWLYLSGTIS